RSGEPRDSRRAVPESRRPLWTCNSRNPPSAGRSPGRAPAAAGTRTERTFPAGTAAGGQTAAGRETAVVQRPGRIDSRYAPASRRSGGRIWFPPCFGCHTGCRTFTGSLFVLPSSIHFAARRDRNFLRQVGGRVFSHAEIGERHCGRRRELIRRLRLNRNGSRH